MIWRIYYADHVVDGGTEDEWRAAPENGVQVVVRFPRQGPRRWTGVEDRDLWTGTDEFDPFGWGVKTGLLLPDPEYLLIWERACADAGPKPI